jgi:hypothetical protein
MLIKFTIDHTDEKKSEYKYFNGLSFGKENEKTGTEWTYIITDTEGRQYRLFHQRRPMVGLRPGAVMRVSLRDNPNPSVANDISRFYTPREFLAEVRETIENRQKRIASDTAEIIRLGDMCELGLKTR